MQKCNHIRPPAFRLMLSGNKPFLCPLCQQYCMIQRQAYERAIRKCQLVAFIFFALTLLMTLGVVPQLLNTQPAPTLSFFLAGLIAVLADIVYFRIWLYPQLNVVLCDSGIHHQVNKF